MEFPPPEVPPPDPLHSPTIRVGLSKRVFLPFDLGWTNLRITEVGPEATVKECLFSAAAPVESKLGQFVTPSVLYDVTIEEPVVPWAYVITRLVAPYRLIADVTSVPSTDLLNHR